MGLGRKYFKAWHNTPALQEIAKKWIASAYKIWLLEREDSLNIESVPYLNCICIIEFVFS